MSDRLNTNLILIEKLTEIVKKHPEQRFSQILLNYGFVSQISFEENAQIFWKDEFYTEPEEILQRLKLDPNH